MCDTASSPDGISTLGSQGVVNTKHDLYFPLMQCIESFTQSEYHLSALQQSLLDKNVTFDQLDNDFWFMNYLRSIPTKKDLLIREYGMLSKSEASNEPPEVQATKKILSVL
jgi:hypothetical protein